MSKVPADGFASAAKQSASIGGSGDDICLGKWVYGPLDASEAALIAAGGMIAKAHFRVRSRSGIGINEEDQDNISQLSIRVTSGATSTIRGTALAGHTLADSSGSNKWRANTTPQNRIFPAAAANDVLDPVAGTVAGDYLVVEMGYRSFTSGTTGAAMFWYDSTTSGDLPDDETTTTELNPWLDLFAAGTGFSAGDVPLDTVRQGDANPGNASRATRCDHEHAHGLLSSERDQYHDASQIDGVGVLSDELPQVEDATGDAGISDEGSRADHVHPENFTRSTLNFIIDGGGSVITTGVKGDVVIDFDCEIEAVTVLADQSGSIVVDIWRDTYANYPPVVGDSITASAKPTISSATKAQDTTLTGWSKTIAAGQTLRYNVDSVTTCQRVTVALKLRRT